MDSDLTSRLDTTRQAVLLFVVAVVPLAFWTRTVDVFQLPKATIVVVAAAALVVISVVRLATTGEVVVPAGPLVYSAVAFVVAVAVATVAADQLAIGVLGAYGRWNGLILYLACIALFLFVIRSFPGPEIERLVRAIVAAVAVVVTYALLQYAGADPIGWSDAIGDGVHASVGNPNFAGATMAIGAPLAARWVVSPTAPLWARLGSGALAIGCVVGAAATGTVQGPVAAAAGLAVVALAVLLGCRTGIRRVGLAALGILAGVGTVVLVAGVRGTGPLGAISDQVGVTLRGYYWEAALSMWSENPVLGVGLGSYGVHHREHRPLEAAVDLPMEIIADAAHSVPLSMFAEGGIILGVTYLVFVVSVGVVAVRGLLRTTGEERLLLGAVTGGWTAYQVQSLVSLDVPPLALLHWVLAGAVVVLAAPPRTVTRRLSWAPTPAQARAAGRAKTKGRPSAKRPAEALASIFGAFAFVVLLVPLTRPLRADMAAFNAGQSDTIEAALEKVDRSLSLAPWEPSYWFLKGRIEAQAGRDEEVLFALLEAIERDPSSLTTIVTVARFAEDRGAIEVARRFYQQALAVDPQSPQLKAEVAAFELENGDAEDAILLLETATALRDDEGEWWQLLGSARLEAGDREGARAAFERALEIDSSDEAAREGLASARSG